MEIQGVDDGSREVSRGPEQTITREAVLEYYKARRINEIAEVLRQPGTAELFAKGFSDGMSEVFEAGDGIRSEIEALVRFQFGSEALSRRSAAEIVKSEIPSEDDFVVTIGQMPLTVHNAHFYSDEFAKLLRAAVDRALERCADSIRFGDVLTELAQRAGSAAAGADDAVVRAALHQVFPTAESYRSNRQAQRESFAKFFDVLTENTPPGERQVLEECKQATSGFISNLAEVFDRLDQDVVERHYS